MMLRLERCLHKGFDLKCRVPNMCSSVELELELTGVAYYVRTGTAVLVRST